MLFKHLDQTGKWAALMFRFFASQRDQTAQQGECNSETTRLSSPTCDNSINLIA